MLFNPIHHLGAVTRAVETRERDGRTTKVVVASRDYSTTAADLWDALTNPERLPRWFLPVSGDLRLGGQYQLKGNAGGTITGCEPPKALAVTWEYGGQISWLTVTLQRQTDTTTRLTLEHMAHIDGHWEEYGPGAAGLGWDMALLGLGLHLDSGEQVDPKQAEGWFASAAGKDFLGVASADWGRASIAAGTPRDAALAAAERCRVAYTGELPSNA